mgnify:FL=1
MIRCADIIDESIVDGEGIRLTVFLQGCPRRCEGCHNPALLPVDGGREGDERRLVQESLKRLTPLHKGITFSGGDPLLQAEELEIVLAELRMRHSDVDIWLYTGYVYEEISHLPALRWVDVLVDGPFVQSERDLTLPYRGSRNQRILDVRKSREAGCAVPYVLAVS